MPKLFLYYIVLFGTAPAFAQMAGNTSFRFLDMPTGARATAMGGVNVSLADRDINFLYGNPALAGDTLAGRASVHYQFYVADIGHAAFTYAHNFKQIGMLAMGVQHLGYGNIDAYDATGQEMGSFKAGETNLVISKSHQISHFRLGVNLKAAFSSIAGYHASALMADVGGVFIHPKHDFTIGMVIKNAGVVVSEYSATAGSTLPFDVQVGTTFKPEHMPLRFSITAYNLVNDDLPYTDGTAEDEPGTLDKVLRRFNFGAELLLHRNVQVMVGYNYNIHQELKLEDAGGMAGVSFGFSAQIKSVEFAFSRSAYVVGNAGYAFTLSADIDKMLKK